MANLFRRPPLFSATWSWLYGFYRNFTWKGEVVLLFANQNFYGGWISFWGFFAISYFFHHIWAVSLHTFTHLNMILQSPMNNLGLYKKKQQQKKNRDPVRSWVGQQSVCQAQDSNMTKTREYLSVPAWLTSLCVSIVCKSSSSREADRLQAPFMPTKKWAWQMGL